MPKTEQLDQAIVDTIRYFDILHLPVTVTMIWRSLITKNKVGDIRLSHLRERLTHSALLQKDIDHQWGYYYLKGKEAMVTERLERHRIAQKKWKMVRRIAWMLSCMPYVRMMGITGSLALSNTTKDSDLDFFIVAKTGRIWTTRLLLLLASELMGKRRRYTDTVAPDKICLNHYVTDTSLAIAADNRNVYNAVTYTHMVPMVGLSLFEQFQRENAAWIGQWVHNPSVQILPSVYFLPPSWFRSMVQRILELGISLLGRMGERAAARLQQTVVNLHQQPQRGGRVVTNNRELAFHPDSKAYQVDAQFLTK